MPREIINLEIHVAHSCNLTCDGCSHFSNHNHRGVVSLDTFKEWSDPWVHRLRPKLFSLLGGEPAIHPKLPEFVLTARKLWPQSGLRLVTNGLLIHRHPDLPLALKEAGHSVLQVTIHHDAPQYLGELSENIKLIREWIVKYGIEVMFDQGFSGWTRRYTGFGDNMLPYNDGNPGKSWENCPGKVCRQLFSGKIWKCAPLAYLNLQNEKYNLSSDWEPYLDYSPLDPSCSDRELDEFFRRKEERFCSMCPADPVEIEKSIPFRKERISEFTYEDMDPFLKFAAFNPAATDPGAVQRAAGLKKSDTDFHRVNGRFTDIR